MNRLAFILFLIGILVIGGGAAWYLVDTRNEAFGTVQPVATSTPEMHEGLAIYTNGTYGFSLFYPEAAIVEYGFDEKYRLGKAWRVNALPDAQGMPVVAIIPYATESPDSYPRYFYAMVRVGASMDPAELERCETAARDQGETALPDAVIGGKTWKAFAFQDAGMMQYVRGISYRVVHEDRCIALEKVVTGSSYREDLPSERDRADSVLEQEEAALSAIVESFNFAR